METFQGKVNTYNFIVGLLVFSCGVAMICIGCTDLGNWGKEFAVGIVAVLLGLFIAVNAILRSRAELDNNTIFVDSIRIKWDDTIKAVHKTVYRNWIILGRKITLRKVRSVELCGSNSEFIKIEDECFSGEDYERILTIVSGKVQLAEEQENDSYKGFGFTRVQD